MGIAAPLAECAGLTNHLFKRNSQNLSAITTLCWLATVLLYLVLNWRTFDQRFRFPKPQDAADAPAGK